MAIFAISTAGDEKWLFNKSTFSIESVHMSTKRPAKPEKLSPGKSSLLLLDVITNFDFEDGGELLKRTLQIAPKLSRLTQRAREARVPVIYVNDNFGKWQEDFKTMADHFMDPTSKGHKVVGLLRPHPDDYYVLKPHRSGFYSTTLELLLRELKAETLVIAGITTDICVLFTANDAYMRGFDLFIPSDCVAAVKPAHTSNTLDFMKRVLKADIRKSSDISFGRKSRR